ncbi:helix-turn-helix domain-containing protein [Clostridium manihotivorum]|uniref:helix-turn-helix domain-containing protein n=1 Tax=Clostridium manihotivorum TaxID=2320868 RepID=UPI0013E3625E|nr:helix-turn-helix transcriptional regulator [Clostridium manihotivorum]
MSISDNIKKIRKDNKLTQRQFAEKINKKEITVRRYESGDIVPPINVLNEISEKFDIPMADIIGDDIGSDIQNKFVDSEVEIANNSDEGIINALDKLHKKPSLIQKEKRIKEELHTILDDFDKFASNKLVEKDIGYKFNDFSSFEQDELFRFMYDMLKIKTTEIKSRNK